MPSLKTLTNYLAHPDRIPERLSEKRMNAAAQKMYALQSPADTQRERAALWGDKAQSLVAEAQARPLYQRLVVERGDRVIASQTTSLDDCVTMYVLVRLYQPRIMVETGVFYGAMSAMILEAMAANGGGRLYSIDLPVPGDGLPLERRGGLVPAERRDAWEFILGDSREKLHPLLEQLGTIDAFNHDSLHTTRHMMWEYATAWPYLKAAGILSSHDVLTTPAWGRFCAQHQVEIQRSGRIFGLGIVVKSG